MTLTTSNSCLVMGLVVTSDYYICEVSSKNETTKPSIRSIPSSAIWW